MSKAQSDKGCKAEVIKRELWSFRAERDRKDLGIEAGDKIEVDVSEDARLWVRAQDVVMAEDEAGRQGLDRWPPRWGTKILGVVAKNIPKKEE